MNVIEEFFMDIGNNILKALRTAATDPMLVAEVHDATQANVNEDAKLETLGNLTTHLQEEFDAFATSLKDTADLDAAQEAKLASFGAMFDSLNAAFPDADQPPAPPEVDSSPTTDAPAADDTTAAPPLSQG